MTNNLFKKISNYVYHLKLNKTFYNNKKLINKELRNEFKYYEFMRYELERYVKNPDRYLEKLDNKLAYTGNIMYHYILYIINNWYLQYKTKKDLFDVDCIFSEIKVDGYDTINYCSDATIMKTEDTKEFKTYRKYWGYIIIKADNYLIGLKITSETNIELLRSLQDEIIHSKIMDKYLVFFINPVYLLPTQIKNRSIEFTQFVFNFFIKHKSIKLFSKLFKDQFDCEIESDLFFSDWLEFGTKKIRSRKFNSKFYFTKAVGDTSDLTTPKRMRKYLEDARKKRRKEKIKRI